MITYFTINVLQNIHILQARNLKLNYKITCNSFSK